MLPPLLFDPILKRIRWGGRRLGTILGKPIGDAADYAESWELVDHGPDQSVVSRGALGGSTLRRLVAEHNAALFGCHAGLRQFPLLVKFLDASDRLSVQVHPDDRRARQFDPAENGKTEAWVILDAAPDSLLWLGLLPGTTAETLRARLADNSVERVLHAVSVQAGDCVFVPAGTVHAIGEGILLAEIQQSSDLTFRLYDWGRLGSDGRPRPLHIEQALSCIDFARGPLGTATPRLLHSGPLQSEELVRCEQFVIHRHTHRETLSIPDDERFHVLLVFNGAPTLAAGDEALVLPRGTTVLLPADRAATHVTPGDGPTVLIDAFLP